MESNYDNNIKTPDVLENPLKEPQPSRDSKTKDQHGPFRQHLENWMKSKNVHLGIIILSVFIVALLIFQAGMTVGFMRASYDRDWNNHYLENFGPGINNPINRMSESNRAPNDHGAFGKIISVSLPTVTILGPDTIEKTIVIAPDTIMRDMHDPVQPTDLVPNMNMVVIGIPNTQGQIEAKFIRILPPLPSNQ